MGIGECPTCGNIDNEMTVHQMIQKILSHVGGSRPRSYYSALNKAEHLRILTHIESLEEENKKLKAVIDKAIEKVKSNG